MSNTFAERHGEDINRARVERGLPELSRAQIEIILRDWRERRLYLREGRTDNESHALDFIIGLTTGIPMPSVGGIAGAALHHVEPDTARKTFQPHPDAQQPAEEPVRPGGGDFGGAGASGSFEQEPSSPSGENNDGGGDSGSSSGSSD